ncbi:hypothetical protein GCM10010343_67080 [Streptomyces avidinii]|nr:hypothetical protein GCM10010343_67080 [Streptomyces avidinii]
MVPGIAVPVHIDVHPIPANESKAEPAHQHFDFRYLFRLEGDQEVMLQEAEVSGYAWRSVETITDETLRVRVLASLRQTRHRPGLGPARSVPGGLGIPRGGPVGHRHRVGDTVGRPAWTKDLVPADQQPVDRPWHRPRRGRVLLREGLVGLLTGFGRRVVAVAAGAPPTAGIR